MTDSVDFKAGDTFSYAAEISASVLDLSMTWGARAWVRDMGSRDRPHPKIDELVCTLTAPVVSGDPYALLLYRASTDTDSWPRPADANDVHQLIVDVELYDDSTVPVVHSTSNFIINVIFDPTRSA